MTFRQSIAEIEDALRTGDRDARTLAMEYGITPGIIKAIRADLQKRMDVDGEGQLPIPPPTSRKYGRAAFTPSEESLRADFKAHEEMTPTKLARKYGMTTVHVERILVKAPSLLDERRKLIDERRSIVEAAMKRGDDQGTLLGRLGLSRTPDSQERLAQFIHDQFSAEEIETWNILVEYNAVKASIGVRFDVYAMDYRRLGMKPRYINGKLQGG